MMQVEMFPKPSPSEKQFVPILGKSFIQQAQNHRENHFFLTSLMSKSVSMLQHDESEFDSLGETRCE
jgi:hypothetical protein